MGFASEASVDRMDSFILNFLFLSFLPYSTEKSDGLPATRARSGLFTYEPRDRSVVWDGTLGRSNDSRSCG